MSRCVAHLDMDAFYASVELQRYPQLRGLPVVTGAIAEQPPELFNGKPRFAKLKGYVGRGVVTTATYEARAFGVSSGMGLMKAAQLAPEAILLPAGFYRVDDSVDRCPAAFRCRREDHANFRVSYGYRVGPSCLGFLGSGPSWRNTVRSGRFTGRAGIAAWRPRRPAHSG
jgi:hypothetical protein